MGRSTHACQPKETPVKTTQAQFHVIGLLGASTASSNPVLGLSTAMIERPESTSSRSGGPGGSSCYLPHVKGPGQRAHPPGLGTRWQLMLSGPCPESARSRSILGQERTSRGGHPRNPLFPFSSPRTSSYNIDATTTSWNLCQKHRKMKTVVG